MAELVFHFVAQIAASVLPWPAAVVFDSSSDSSSSGDGSPSSSSRHHQSPAPLELPPPMLPGNWEPSSPSCFFGEALKRIVVDADGFEYKNDATRQRGKWGMVANGSGASLRLRLVPRDVLAPAQLEAAAAAAAGAEKKAGAAAAAAKVVLEFVYLKSWDRMGQAEVGCQGPGARAA